MVGKGQEAPVAWGVRLPRACGLQSRLPRVLSCHGGARVTGLYPDTPVVTDTCAVGAIVDGGTPVGLWCPCAGLAVSVHSLQSPPQGQLGLWQHRPGRGRDVTLLPAPAPL